MTIDVIAFAGILLVGFALSFWMPSRSAALWNIVLSVVIGGLFVYWAATDPEGRAVRLLFALVAFGLAYRGWKERRSQRGRTAAAE